MGEKIRWIVRMRIIIIRGKRSVRTTGAVRVKKKKRWRSSKQRFNFACQLVNLLPITPHLPNNN